MSVTPSVATILRDHVRLELESIDRMYLNVSVPQLQYERGISCFFRFHRRHTFASSALMEPMTRAFVAGIQEFVAQEHVPLVEFAKHERKDDVAQRHLAKFKGREGVLFIGRAQEKSRVFRTERRHNAQTHASYAALTRSSAMVNHFYFYCVDEDFGPFFLKFCTYFPYTAKLCINGHEYLKRQLRQRGISFEALDNGILSCADPKRMQQIADGLTPARIDALLRKWLRRLPHPFTPVDRRAGYRYQLSILQAEFSLTQIFDRPVSGRMFFDQVIRENLDLGRPDQVQLIFGRKVIRTTPGRFRTRVVNDGVTPSLHVDYKHSRIKQYFKEGRGLRTETTINDTRDFQIGRALRHLPALRRIGFQANRRLLDVQRATQDCALGENALASLSAPALVDGQRTPALRILDPRIHALLSVLVSLALHPRGFSNQDLRARLAPQLGKRPGDIAQGQATYQLRRLRLRGFIQRIKGTHRYRVTSVGLRSALFLAKVRTRILGPGLSHSLTPALSADPRFKFAFDQLDAAIDDLVQQAQLAA